MNSNKFEGSLATFPSNVYFLDLGSRFWIYHKISFREGFLGNLYRLNVIDISNNILTGVVPSSLGSLKYLYSLHLQNNKFEGDIPVPLQNLTDLVTIDLGNNLFTGTKLIGFYI
ncbi:putative non-specific serine/threonine protein kinase [Helianthus annuus]|uniref:Non-specific serine/threonine protein kinase n=2 Tax=Helianthus annuus TaxID=4232 RepID=A0A9K3MV06_HELAN|nr:putative non-specific serine/threonine protein kinase [Helianthus annuus]KAJ0488831.1 putative non-specific serine/threonine protein kinase [Helianthus annuus]KAJ0492421.1 putative non-specific serine/threonine protein kinase [Helianthus annuus]KAJ0504674.1 putative non-specific serine/threonine protein kinase [Helianthus annuus]KAJ0674403.1 putative non-specific serine/threonine protein kinase [Helianthus annuus]